jgi:hypothetical protein
MIRIDLPCDVCNKVTVTGQERDSQARLCPECFCKKHDTDPVPMRATLNQILAWQRKGVDDTEMQTKRANCQTCSFFKVDCNPDKNEYLLPCDSYVKMR